MKQKIEQLSIRARVAFILLCIENAVSQSHSVKKWDKVLQVLWEFTDIEFVDDWLYKCSRIMPSSILEDEYEKNDEFSRQDYDLIKQLYRSTPQYLFDLLECVYVCGTVELYGKVKDNSTRTTDEVLKSIEILNNNQIRIPEIDLLNKFSFQENLGWGERFNRKEIFSN